MSFVVPSMALKAVCNYKCISLYTVSFSFTDHKSLPTLNRIPGLKLSGQAFADTLMVFEFLHNFGETLGFGECFACRKVFLLLLLIPDYACASSFPTHRQHSQRIFSLMGLIKILSCDVRFEGYSMVYEGDCHLDCDPM
jgi:hypothetical protein